MTPSHNLLDILSEWAHPRRERCTDSKCRKRRAMVHSPVSSATLITNITTSFEPPVVSSAATTCSPAATASAQHGCFPTCLSLSLEAPVGLEAQHHTMHAKGFINHKWGSAACSLCERRAVPWRAGGR